MEQGDSCSGLGPSGGRGERSACYDASLAWLTAAAENPLWSETEQATVLALDRLIVLRNAVEGHLAQLLGKLDQDGIAASVGALDTAGWVRGRYRTSRTEARALVEQSTRLRDERVATAAAMVAGQCSASQARAITDGLTELPAGADPDQVKAGEEFLLDQAKVLDPAGMRRASDRLVEDLTQLSEDGAEPVDVEPVDPQARRMLRLQHRDGGVEGVFRLPGESGARFVALITAWSQPDSQRFADPADPLGRDTRTRDQRQADAMSAAIDHASGCKNTTRPAVPHVLLTLDYDTLVADLHGLPEDRRPSRLLDSDQPLSGAEARRLACDAALIPLVLGADSEPLDVGHDRRLFTAHIRRAIILRDQGCIMPGCAAPPSACDAHHIIPWAEGGRTSLQNGALLCPFHHRLLHQQRWTVRLDILGNPELIPPAWIDPERQPRQHHRYPLRM